MSHTIGYIHIDYTMREDGTITTGFEIDGDIPVTTQLGLLELAKDTILHPPTKADLK